MPALRRGVFLSFWAVFCFASQAEAALITPTSVQVEGGHSNGSPGLVTDGSIPGEGQFWQSNTVWWNGLNTYITLDFGSLYTIQDVLVSVDNNDSYRLSYSTDNLAFTTLETIDVSFGEIGGGMDTMSSQVGHPEYISGIDFSPVQARYLRIQATGGDNSYSVGELQAFGDAVVAAVPEPTSLALLGLGALGLIVSRRCLIKRRV